MKNTITVSRFASWAPGMTKAEDWLEWAKGEREIARTKDAPAIEYTDPLFRRRQSQISRMTIEVLHELLPIGPDTKIVFVSFRGELNQQFKINRMLIEDGDLTPAAFSLSVFNTPPALAAIALDLRAGYSAVYPAKNSFTTGLLSAAAPVLGGSAGEIVFVYADELCTQEYAALPGSQNNEPFAFAALLSAKKESAPTERSAPLERSIPLPLDLTTPQELLKYLYKHRELM
jgi:hypothetical protein